MYIIKLNRYRKGLFFILQGHLEVLEPGQTFHFLFLIIQPRGVIKVNQVYDHKPCKDSSQLLLSPYYKLTGL